MKALKIPNVITRIDLSKETPEVEESPVDVWIEKILKMVRARHRSGKLVARAIIAGFLLVGLIMVVAIPAIFNKLVAVATVAQQHEVSTKEIDDEYAQKHKARQVALEEYAQKVKRDEFAIRPDPIGFYAEADRLGHDFAYLAGGFGTAVVAIWLLGILVFLVVFAVLSYFFLPTLLALPLAMSLSSSWIRPYNVLLLRPFSQKRTSASLKGLVREGLAGLGFFYTLADSRIKQRWYIKYPVFLGQLSFLQFRSRKIRCHKAVSKIPVLMGRRRRRIYNWCVSRDKIFALKCADAYWKDSVRELFSSVDWILLDLSDMRPGVQWEMDECRRLSLLPKVVFIAEAGQQRAIMKRSAEIGTDITEKIIFYGNDPAAEAERVLDHMARRLAYFHAAAIS